MAASEIDLGIKLSPHAIGLRKEHDLKTEAGRTALHNRAYFDGMFSGDRGIVWAAEELGSDYHGIVEPAFENGKAQKPHFG